MIRIGKYVIGYAPLSMAILFVVLSICAVLSALIQVRPEYPMPLSGLIIVNECIALIVTLVFGIIIHLIISFSQWNRKRKV